MKINDALSSSGGLPIDVLAVADTDDENEEDLVPDLVDYTIVTHPESIEVFPSRKLSGTPGRGIHSQGGYLRQDSGAGGLRQGLQVPDRPRTELDPEGAHSSQAQELLDLFEGNVLSRLGE